MFRLRLAVATLAMCAFCISDAAAADQLSGAMTAFAQRCADESLSIDHPELLLTDDNYTGKWRVTTMNELASCENCYDTALIWRSAKATVVKFEGSSETQDWFRHLLYCFDANGRATGAFLSFNSAEGWAFVSYFAARNGVFVPTTSNFRNLRTWAAVPEPSGWAGYREAHGTPAPYLTIGQLPFAALLRHTR